METPHRRVIARTRSYRALLTAFRAYFEEKEITFQAIDQHSGLMDGYAAKLFTNPPMKNLGPTSLTLLLQTMGLEIWLVERDDATIDEIPKRSRPLRNKLAVTSQPESV